MLQKPSFLCTFLEYEMTMEEKETLYVSFGKEYTISSQIASAQARRLGEQEAQAQG